DGSRGRGGSRRGGVVPSPVSGVRPMTENLPHLNPEGEVHMVDVGRKDVTTRRATAEARVRMSPELTERLFSGDLPKGDALATVRLAGIMAAKRTPELIPLAHPIGLDSVEVRVERVEAGVRCVAERSATARAAVETKAGTAAAVAALAGYEMVQRVGRDVG